MKFLFAGLCILVLLSDWAYGDDSLEQRFVQNFELSPVKDVVINGFGKVDIEQGERNQLTLTANEDIGRFIELTMEQGRLTIVDTRADSLWFQAKHMWWRFLDSERKVEAVSYQVSLIAPENITLNGHLMADIHHLATPELNVAFSGLGRLSLEQLTQDSLAIVLKGKVETRVTKVSAGKVDLTFNGVGSLTTNRLFTDALHASINGNISSHLSGRTSDLHLQMQGASKCQGQSFAVDRAYLVLSDQSQLTLEVNQHLDAYATDSAQLFYYGNPAIEVKGNPITHLAGGYQAKTYY